MKQRTLLREVSVKGNALHTGDAVHMTLKPAPVNHGVVFKRMDLHGHKQYFICGMFILRYCNLRFNNTSTSLSAQ